MSVKRLRDDLEDSAMSSGFDRWYLVMVAWAKWAPEDQRNPVDGTDQTLFLGSGTVRRPVWRIR